MAASAFFSSAATELICSIFEECESLAQIRNLVLVSRRLHSVWVAHGARIIESLGFCTIPAFETGSIALRATDMVKQAQLAGQLPPEIDPSSLGISAKRPTLSEYRGLLDLNHFDRCLEVQYCQSIESKFTESLDPTAKWPMDRYGPHNQQEPLFGRPELVELRLDRNPIHWPEDPESNGGLEKWRQRFAQAVYTALLIPTILSRAYNMPYAQEPFRSMLQRGEMSDVAAVDSTKEYNDDTWHEFDEILHPAEVEHFSGFPAYDRLDRLGRHSEIFGPLADWIVGTRLSALRANGDVAPVWRDDWGQRRPHVPRWTRDAKWNNFKPPQITFAHGSQEEAENMLWEVMQALHIAEFIYSMLCCDTRGDATACHEQLRQTWVLPEEKTCGPKIALVPFGHFRAEEVQLPTHAADMAVTEAQLGDHVPDLVEWADYECLLANMCQAVPLEAPQTRYFPEIASALWHADLQRMTPNHFSADPVDGCRTQMPPAPLQFFEFLLREHFGVAFRPGVFAVPDRGTQDYEGFRLRATIFANRPEDVPEREDVPKRGLGDCSAGFEILVSLAEYQAVLEQGLEFQPIDCPNYRFHSPLKIT